MSSDKKQDFFTKNKDKVPFISTTATIFILVSGLLISAFNLATANKLEPLKGQLGKLDGRVFALESDHTRFGGAFSEYKDKNENRFDTIEGQLNQILGYFNLTQSK